VPRPIPASPEASDPAPLSDGAIVTWWRAQSARQGLPEKITDPAVLARVVTLALGPPEAGERHA
jgi:hypothetical protein